MTEEQKEKDLQFLKSIEDAIREMGLNITPSGYELMIESCLEGEKYYRDIYVVYEPGLNLVRVAIVNGDVPDDRSQQLIRVINIANNRFTTGHYYFDPTLGTAIVSAGIYPKDHIDKDAFKKLLIDLLAHSLQYGMLFELIQISDEGTIDRWQDFFLGNKKLEKMNKE